MTRVAKQCGTSGKDDSLEPRSAGAANTDKSNSLQLNKRYIDRERYEKSKSWAEVPMMLRGASQFPEADR